jgi:endonuclease/exonuclease/phosphatase (EEP) superfamily protein YafD
MTSFRVLQFNMQFGQGWDDASPDAVPIDLDGTIAEIRRHRADIVLLQEVEQAHRDGSQPPQPPNYSALRHALTEFPHSHFALPPADPRELPFGIGLAIFSRTPLGPLVRRVLPSPAISFEFDGEKKTPTDRLLIGAGTEIGGRRLQVFNTHLLAFFMLNHSSQEYHGQREMVAETMRALEGAALIGGDFNVSRHASLVAEMDAIGYATAQAREVTWRRRPYVLDHLFYRSAALRCVGYQVCPTSASDHCALVGDFEFL